MAAAGFVKARDLASGLGNLSSRTLTMLAAGGGHVGFHGAGSRIAWHDRAIVRFFANP